MAKESKKCTMDKTSKDKSKSMANKLANKVKKSQGK
jgi:hypothetical protein